MPKLHLVINILLNDLLKGVELKKVGTSLPRISSRRIRTRTPLFRSTALIVAHPCTPGPCPDVQKRTAHLSMDAGDPELRGSHVAVAAWAVYFQLNSTLLR